MCKYFSANYAGEHVVIWENLHNWHKFYMIAGRGGRDKSHLWLNIVNLMISIEKNCLFLINCNSDSPFFSCCPSLSSPWWKRSRPLEAVTWWECFRNESTLSHCMKFIQFTKHNSNQFNRDDNSCLKYKVAAGLTPGVQAHPTQVKFVSSILNEMKWSFNVILLVILFF